MLTPNLQLPTPKRSPRSRGDRRHPGLPDVGSWRQVLPSRRAHALPDRTSQARRANAHLVIRAPSALRLKRDCDDEQAATRLARRADHLRRRSVLAVQVAAITELARRPVVAGAAGPAVAAAGRALRFRSRWHVVVSLLYPLHRSEGVENGRTLTRARRDRLGAHVSPAVPGSFSEVPAQ